MSNTSVWIPGKRSGWGSPGGRCGSLPGHHCSVADPAPGVGPVSQPNQADDSFRASSLWAGPDPSPVAAPALKHIPASRDSGWCSARSSGWCSGASPSAWWAILCRAARRCGTCLSWFYRRSRMPSPSSPWPDPDPRSGPLVEIKRDKGKEVRPNSLAGKEKTEWKCSSTSFVGQMIGDAIEVRQSAYLDTAQAVN